MDATTPHSDTVQNAPACPPPDNPLPDNEKAAREGAEISRKSRRNLFSALLRARLKQGGGATILIDADGRKLTYIDMIRGAFALGRPIAKQTRRGENVGILLPSGAGAAVAFFALQAYGRVPAMLNFTSGARNLKAAAKAAKISRVLTARKFIELGKYDKLISELQDELDVLYLEDIKDRLDGRAKLAGAVGPYLPWLFREKPFSSAPGVLLFTSGTEGAPKGVVLTHRNVLANINQINRHVKLLPTDILYNPLPTFHCYGLTAGLLWPMMTGRPIVLHPSPLQTKVIPKRIKETQATILLATDTFLQQYARASDDDDLRSLRLAVCGAERVRDETRGMVKRRFGLDVLEGYGVTEAAPVIAANQPGDIRAGTVGRLLPGIEARLEAVEGLSDAGRLFVRGPNVMEGYLCADRPGEIQKTPDGWHDTGDIVSFDRDGYMSIRGRAKRFAKIGGEMISLAVVENCASAAWPEHMHAAVTVPDARKGEQIILLTENPDADRARLLAWAQSHGVPELAVPRKLLHIDAVPVLGTGKIDYVAVREAALARLVREDESRAETATAPENAAPSLGAKPARGGEAKKERKERKHRKQKAEKDAENDGADARSDENGADPAAAAE